MRYVYSLDNFRSKLELKFLEKIRGEIHTSKNYYVFGMTSYFYNLNYIVTNRLRSDEILYLRDI